MQEDGIVRLVVDEGGVRRSFRMGKGVLTVGSGAEARLRLASSEVAEIHFELELGSDGAKLRPRPGVVPPKVRGVAIRSEQALALGTAVEVGGVRLWLEAEASESSASPSRSGTVPAGPVPASGTGSKAARIAARRAGTRGRPGGAPGWLVPLLVLGLTGVVFLLWFRSVQSGAEGGGMAVNKIRAARQAAASANFADALRELAEIPATALTPELAQEKEALEKDLRDGQAEIDLRLANLPGTKYLDTLLKKYEGHYLQGKPDHAKARLFLMRCRTFRERWPKHPEMDWVRRQEERFAGYIDLNQPPSWEDVQWEVRDLVEGSPRNYVSALALLDELLARVEGEEHVKAQNLRDELTAGRVEYATDRLYQAKYEFEQKKDPNKAVWWLVHNIAWLGDEALADENARFLVKMPELAGHLLGYKQNYPDRYEAVLRNPVVAAWAENAGFRP